LGTRGVSKLLEETEHHRLRLELSGLPYRPLARAEHQHAVLRGMRFHYVAWGEHAGCPILFLHGGGQTCRTWDVVCHELAPDYSCIALDLRGHGDSEWSYESDYRIEAHAADTAALIDALDLPRLVIVGMSLGGMTGLHYALGHPDRVAGFVAVDVGPWVDVEGGAPIRQFMQEVASLDELEQFVDAALRFNPRRDARLLRHSLWNNLRSCPDGRLMWKTDLRQLGDRSTAVTAGLGALQERIADLRCPTLIVRGSDSPILREEHARRFAEAIPNGRSIAIEGAGHNVQGDQPAALVRALRDFLDEIEASSTGREKSPL
jgi:pimeloyl-ACP methyl ester carboxylesterase